MDKKLTPLPDWIVKDQSVRSGYKIKKSLKPLQCTNCYTTWYPRIKGDGEIILPQACANPACRTKAYRKVRK